MYALTGANGHHLKQKPPAEAHVIKKPALLPKVFEEILRYYSSQYSFADRE